jgi:TRAP-type C4-dicarboxylate transport system permease small subunit
MVAFLHSALSWLRRLLRWYVIMLMAALVILTFVQVVARYVMDSPFTATDQLVRIVLVWLTFIGTVVAIDQNKNIRIETIEQLLPEKARLILSVFFDAVLIALLAVLTIKGHAVFIVGKYQTILGTPFSYQVMYAAAMVGTILMAVCVAIRLLFKLGVLDHSWIGEVE